MDSRSPRLAAAIGIAIASVTGLAFLALSSTGSINATASRASVIDDSYLDPCYTCTPTEEDFENLTTFELLAKYPQLSGDPIDNDTATASVEDESLGEGEPAVSEQNMTDTASFNATLTVNNQTTTSGGSASTNNTNSTQ